MKKPRHAVAPGAFSVEKTLQRRNLIRYALQERSVSTGTCGAVADHESKRSARGFGISALPFGRTSRQHVGVDDSSRGVGAGDGEYELDQICHVLFPFGLFRILPKFAVWCLAPIYATLIWKK
jgi:hypothetical protein